MFWYFTWLYRIVCITISTLHIMSHYCDNTTQLIYTAIPYNYHNKFLYYTTIHITNLNYICKLRYNVYIQITSLWPSTILITTTVLYDITILLYITVSNHFTQIYCTTSLLYYRIILHYFTSNYYYIYQWDREGG